MLLHTARRHASSTAAAATTTAATAPGGNGRRFRKAVEWFRTTGKYFRHAQPGANLFVSGRSDQPFPMNPLFRPAQPLNDRLREEIYKRYSQSPEENTPRKLSFDFALSVKRVEAIIKLKAHERAMANAGLALQTDFQEKMEKMLGARKMPLLTEKMDTKTIEAVPPYLLAVDESVEFSESNAHKLLGQSKKRSDGVAKAKRAQPANKTPSGAVDTKSTTLDVLSRDPGTGSSRFRYVFTDTSKGPKNLSFIVRDMNGALRTATPDERALRLVEIKTPRHRPLYKA
ncbi:hypothetical protein RI367_006304 [Sorochytrium milnesiophthora]